ncbi:hypothetical protein HY029_00180 [Candidatus Gottesmanbacteria bacterium]|nr:hypothetical protein [Candidatus Gottesmanbacteria bacterium]
MYLDPKTNKEKIDAAMQLLLEETTTVTKFEKIRILIKGINPKLDKTLESCSKGIKTLKRLQAGDVIELTATNLPEQTEEQKKRKKALLFLISSWKNLRAEVARVQKLFNEQAKEGKVTTQEQLATTGKLISTSKGPFGLITALAVLIVGVGAALAYLNYSAVSITIKNQGCSPITPVVELPVPIPGIKLPTETINSGGQAVASVPPFTVNVDGTRRGLVVISAFKFNMEYNFGGNTNLIFDNQSLVGKNTTINLGSSKTHELILSCSK